jgi:hypothetical protein
MVNGSCYRKVLLEYLGERKLPNSAERVEVKRSRYCSGCNPSLHPPKSILPVLKKPLSKLKGNTRARFMLQLLEE